MHISHFSSSESNAITSKKGEEYHSRELVVHTGNHQICNDDVRNIWERFVNLMSTDSLSFPIFFSVPTFFLQIPMTCRNLCERLYSKYIVGKSHYEGGKKYCRRCEVYFYHDNKFCLSCGMALRLSPIVR